VDVIELTFWTPILSTTFQLTSTFFFLIIVMKLAKVQMNRDSYMALLGISFILGYFLFQFVLVLIVLFVIILILSVLRRKRVFGSFFPPESDEAREVEETEEE